MSDIVERAQATLAVLEAEAGSPDALDMKATIDLIFNLLRATSCMPALIAEVTELRTELKWVNA